MKKYKNLELQNEPSDEYSVILIVPVDLENTNLADLVEEGIERLIETLGIINVQYVGFSAKGLNSITYNSILPAVVWSQLDALFMKEGRHIATMLITQGNKENFDSINVPVIQL